ncbi:flagellar biosynthesis protein FlhF [Thiohalobacter sp. IOR34]|uniref:flagellar biosynthesis protein FlhF n=1 Tax=Thiohalobacter sp. IOR34 TaxID=3057176 RepID=UPI0025AF4A69|nr:flagellar biosynthesis protein FlhF [Thiohalobacter sp. IOR34]WJW74560.1 flagellar biosynthesis protein FlhF [Thiohalobacter sp. IOR34]
MKIKRFFAADMRQALGKVRDTLGPDAVILSNRKVEGGVEIIAAVDYDEAAVRQAATPQVAEPQPAADAAGAARYQQVEAGSAASRAEAQADPGPAPAAASPGPRVADIQWSQDPAIVAMRNEIHELRGLLENQLAHLAWGELNRSQPLRAGLLRRLSALGLPQALCQALAGRIAGDLEPEQAWRQVLALFAEQIPVTNDDILSEGGVVALVGSTGVGKTTTVAKLAARYALRHGQRNVALITTDSYRIGAHEQLLTYGRILGMPVQVAANHEELATALKSLLDKRLVLIDTAGMSQRDLRLSEQFATLREAGIPIRSYLVMAASTQTPVLEEAVRAFGASRLDGCILTKLDEAASLGGALAVAAQQQLPLAYVGDGQRVPEDLHPARPHKLVALAASLMQQVEQETDDDTLAERFGGLATHAHA